MYVEYGVEIRIDSLNMLFKTARTMNQPRLSSAFFFHRHLFERENYYIALTERGMMDWFSFHR